MDWENYYHLAKEIQSKNIGSCDESRYRCAISRFYYSAFCHCRNKMKNVHNSKFYCTGKDHGLLIEYLKKIKKDDLVKIIRYLRDHRNSADYDDEYKFGKLEENCIYIENKTKKALELINDITNEQEQTNEDN